MSLPLAALFDIGQKAIGLIPDGKTRSEKAVKLKELMAQGDEALLAAAVNEMFSQITLNEMDAKKSMFFAAARPFVLWGCGFGVLTPVFAWILNTIQGLLLNFELIDSVIRVAGIEDTGQMMTMVAGVLGLGAYRTMDKIKGTQTDKL